MSVGRLKKGRNQYEESRSCPGRKYLRRRSTTINDILRTAERWIKCERITDTGAVFSREFEEDMALTDKQIEEELRVKP